ncbi:DNA repair protein RadA [Naumannella cuiyingiana]|uniref:DNA repair protein RadA n=1 Tax=Naumannella cuiyingiana TaxID=1347891 RepID=A0A7Z0D9I0_9ACTN|nr:DNA repair protein RadA [Naumannella cuiyingiana]NYI71470.1 DNA repair protein RadA/Sms [Naumannella cuiyingiana]
MAKAAAKPGFRCSECGWATVRWVGRCGECQAWGSVQEVGAPKLREVRAQAPTSGAVPIARVPSEGSARALTGVGELDRVLGGGLVPGAVVLLAGEPGVGKSTLVLEVAARWARAGRRTLYVSGEESAAQVRLRAGRTDALADELYLAAETDLGTVLGHIEQTDPSLLVVDSVQTIGTPDADGSPGGVTQVREVTGALVRIAKSRGMAVLIIGHVTKDGSIAGPRLLEHLVDVVLAFEGDRHSGFRMVRASKNRFGPADEVGCFELVDAGIAEVPDPSGLFVSQSVAVPGTAITVTMEGRRPLLAEVQALVTPTPQQNPSRVSAGLDRQRLAMVLAVLQKRCRMPLHNQDCHASSVGGARVTEPSADLALAVSIASSYVDAAPVGVGRVVALGEIGLAGELRRVPGLERRIAEAGRLGFDTAIVPASLDLPPGRGHRDERLGITIKPVATVMEAMEELGFPGRRRAS